MVFTHWNNLSRGAKRLLAKGAAAGASLPLHVPQRRAVTPRLHAVLECTPTLLTAMMLLLVPVLLLARPVVSYYSVMFTSFFCACDIFWHVVWALVGLRNVAKAEQVPWDIAAKSAGVTRDNVTHVIIVPSYKDPEMNLVETLRSFKHTAGSCYVVLAMEEREEGSFDKANRVREEMIGNFADIFITVHPGGVEGEVAGKASNVNYAARKVDEALVGSGRASADSVLMSIIDSDSVFHEMYFDAIAAQFVASKSRYTMMFQPYIAQYGMVSMASPINRISAGLTTSLFFGTMASPISYKNCLSCYSLSLNLARRVNYWDPIPTAEDHHMMLKCLSEDPSVRVTPVALPVVCQVPTELRDRFTQVMRHSSVVVEWGAFVSGLIRNGHLGNTHALYVSASLMKRIVVRVLGVAFPLIRIAILSQYPYFKQLPLSPTLTAIGLTMTYTTIALNALFHSVMMNKYYSATWGADRNTPSFQHSLAHAAMDMAYSPPAGVVFALIPSVKAFIRPLFYRTPAPYVVAPKMMMHEKLMKL